MPHVHELIDREQAKAAGEVYYFTGEQCNHGHIDLRYVKNGGCVTCVKRRSKDWVAKNKERALARGNAWRDTNRERVREQERQRYNRNATENAEKAKRRREANPDKARAASLKSHNKHKEKRLVMAKEWKRNNASKVAQSARAWRDKNREKVRALNTQRKKCIRQRTPSWADRAAILQFYIDRPEGYEVDHIIPLQGDNVSGLHVLNNLQYLAPIDNHVKNKFFDPVGFVA